MIFGLFGSKKEVEKLREEVENSFNHVKRDFNKVGDWIKHLDGKSEKEGQVLEDLKVQILEMQKEILDIKEYFSFFGAGEKQASFKQPQTIVDKQAMSVSVQTPVQTNVQTDLLSNLTVMERAIVWAFLNADMKLSYDDLAALLGKEKSTIRGQINTIKQKSEGLIEESRELNGKKRLYIPEKMRELILKNVKVRVRGKRLSRTEEKD